MGFYLGFSVVFRSSGDSYLILGSYLKHLLGNMFLKVSKFQSSLCEF